MLYKLRVKVRFNVVDQNCGIYYLDCKVLGIGRKMMGLNFLQRERELVGYGMFDLYPRSDYGAEIALLFINGDI